MRPAVDVRMRDGMVKVRLWDQDAVEGERRRGIRLRPTIMSTYGVPGGSVAADRAREAAKALGLPVVACEAP